MLKEKSGYYCTVHVSVATTASIIFVVYKRYAEYVFRIHAPGLTIIQTVAGGKAMSMYLCMAIEMLPYDLKRGAEGAKI